MSVPIRHTPCSNTGRRPCHCETVVVGVGVVAFGGVCRMEVPGQVLSAGAGASHTDHAVPCKPSLRTLALHTVMHPLSAHSHSHDTTGGQQGCCCCRDPLRLGWDTLPSTEGCPRLPTQCIPIARHCNTWEAAAWGCQATLRRQQASAPCAESTRGACPSARRREKRRASSHLALCTRTRCCAR